MAKNKKTNNSKLEKSPEMLAIEQKITDLTQKKTQLEVQKSELNNKKSHAESNMRETEKNQQEAIRLLADLEDDAYEIREAIRNIEKLKLANNIESARDEILYLISKGTQITYKNSQNDDELLAVALSYKLNDVVLYTKDKNLKNKATAFGIVVA